jgi:hypothetical protein
VGKRIDGASDGEGCKFGIAGANAAIFYSLSNKSTQGGIYEGALQNRTSKHSRTFKV